MTRDGAPGIGPQLREARGRDSLTLPALAGEIGLARGSVPEIERDLRSPSVATLLRLRLLVLLSDVAPGGGSGDEPYRAIRESERVAEQDR